MGKLLPRGERGRAPDVGQELRSARERIGRVRELITDSGRTLFALVTIPEAMSVLETERTMRQLADQSIPVSVVFANQVQPPSDDCRHCRLRHQIHQREISRLTELVDGVPLRLVESKPSVIRGPEALAELGRELWS